MGGPPPRQSFNRLALRFGQSPQRICNKLFMREAAGVLNDQPCIELRRSDSRIAQSVFEHRKRCRDGLMRHLLPPGPAIPSDVHD